MKKNFSFLICGVMLVCLSSCYRNEPEDPTNGSDNNGGTVQNGPKEVVDLGLPSGTLWATCNVGATSPEDYGAYFAWGEIEPKSYYDWSTYKYGSDYDELTKYCTKSYYGTVDNKTTLDATDDAAIAHWGGDWRMPTKAELQELVSECIWTWTDNYNNTGVAGRIVKGKNGNSIFLPAAGSRNDSSPDDAGSSGYYWSSSLDDFCPSDAYYLNFSSDDYDWYRYGYTRYSGRSVRPVCSSR